jgi:hypothetical protein
MIGCYSAFINVHAKALKLLYSAHIGDTAVLLSWFRPHFPQIIHNYDALHPLFVLRMNVFHSIHF